MKLCASKTICRHHRRRQAQYDHLLWLGVLLKLACRRRGCQTGVNDCPNLFQLVWIYGTTGLRGRLSALCMAVTKATSCAQPQGKKTNKSKANLPPGAGFVSPLMQTGVTLPHSQSQETVLRNYRNTCKRFGVFFLSVLRGSLRPPCWPNDERLMECCTATPKQTRVRGSLIQTEYGESFTSTLAWKPHTWKFQWLNFILWSRNNFI